MFSLHYVYRVLNRKLINSKTFVDKNISKNPLNIYLVINEKIKLKKNIDKKVKAL